MDDAEWTTLLLAGPRGRDVCLDLTGVSPFALYADLLPQDRSDRSVVWLDSADIFYRPPVVTAVVEALRLLDPAEVVVVSAERLMAALSTATSSAAYWQPPEEDQVLLGRPEVIEALTPVAAALAATPGVGWWTDPVDLTDQHFVSWTGRRTETRASPPALEGTADRLAAWQDATLATERRARGWPTDPARGYSGDWWSTPVGHAVVTTSPSRSGLPATELVLVEDELGFAAARVARLQPRSDVRVYEITRPADWVDLVARYPLPVDRSRRHDWYEVTGSVGPWLIPDWVGIAADYDAVHLTVLGYLATAGRALAVDTSCTLLAGFEPGVTYWLADVLEQAEPPRTWRAHRRPAGDSEWRVSPD